MIRWIPYTFIRILFFLIGGILLGIYFPGAVNPGFAWILASVLVCLYIIVFLLSIKGFKSINPGYVGLPAMLALGYLLVLLRTASNDPNHFISRVGDITAYEVTITSYPEEKQKSWRLVGEVSRIYTDNGWSSVSGNILLYFSKEGVSEPFLYGDQLLVKGSPVEVSAPGNPGEFDYKKYLAFRNIFHQHFIRANEVVFLKETKPNLFVYHSMKLRAWAESVIDRYVPGMQEKGIASALILGITDGLDHDLLNAYSSTGTMHVLAVSGLHVSILYLIVLALLKPLEKLKRGKLMIAAVSLAVLWIYAFVSGMSPSVMRAITMFSFVIVAKAWGRDTNIYNTLAASAFCLLLFDPFLIMSVGFQLSYLAVIGIVYIHPLLFELFETRTWLAHQLWTLTSVSIAAQLATFPLGLLYFHQFPNYFLLSNLLIIPISYGVLVIGLALLAVSFLDPVVSIVGIALSWLIKLMNMVVQLIEWLPFSLIDGIYISVAQCMILLAILVSSIVMLQQKNFRALIVGASLSFLFAGIQWSDFMQTTAQHKFIVFRIPGLSATEFIHDARAYILSDSLEQGKVSFHIQPAHLRAYVGDVQPVPAKAKSSSGENHLVVWNAKTFLFLQEDTPVTIPGDVDFVIISHDALTDFDMLQGLSSRTKIIFDSSNSYSYVNRTRKKLLHLDTHSVLHQGAYEAALDEPHEIHSI